MITDNTGTVVGTNYTYGTGVAPQVNFLPGTLSTLTGNTYNSTGIAVDGTRNLYYSDYTSQSLFKLPWMGSAYGAPVSVASSGITQAVDVAVDSAGNLYVANGTGNNILKYTWNGSVYSASPTALGGGTLDDPKGVVVDSLGNIYVANNTGNNVVEIPWNGSGYGTPAVVASLPSAYPNKITIDNAGNLFVSVFSSGKIVEIPFSSGSYGAPVTIDTGYSNPWGVVTDNNYNLYTSDATATGPVYEYPWNGSSYGAKQLLFNVPNGVTGLAFDPFGNFLMAGGNNYELNRNLVPTLAFQSSVVGTQSSDSPLTVSVTNVGNAALNFSVPLTGYNPSISASFTSDNSTTCPSISSSGSVQSLAANATCNLSVDFIPQAAGSISGSLVLTDNNLNVAGSTQTIALSGTGVANVTQLAFITVPTASVTAGGNAGTSIAVAEENAGGTTVTSATDTITITVTGPNGYSKTYTAAAVNGVATFNLGSAVLTAAGGYTYTASVASSPSITNAAASETVVAAAANSVTATGSAASTQSKAIGLAYQYPFSVTVVDQYGNPVQGATVTYSVPSSGASAVLSATTATTNASGAASVTGTANGIVGGYNVTASIAGVSAKASFPVANLQGAVTVALTLSPATPIVYGSSKTTLTAKVTGANGVTTTPTGTVTFYNNGTALGSAATLSSGSGALALYLPVGTYTNLTASYQGDTNFLTGASTAASYTVTQAAPAVVVTSNANPVWIGAAVTYSATVTGAPGAAAPTGTVTFYDGSTSLGTASANASGVATITATPATSGTHSITAAIAADSNYKTATSSALAEVAVDFTVAVASGGSSTASVLPGTTATYNLVVTPVGGTTFPGAITLSAAGAPAGATATLTPSTIASGASTTSLSVAVATSSTTLVSNHFEGLGRKLASLSLALLFLPLAGFRRARKAWMRSLMVLVLLTGGLAAAAGLSGCSLPSGYFGQAPKTFTVTVTGNNGSFTRTTSVTLTVE
ncbi:MAG: Ig-like domain repeat protein [Terracidiphilus sp.]|nr:Ig-like domain repeat protein [Terracidiphilus sp.]